MSKVAEKPEAEMFRIKSTTVTAAKKSDNITDILYFFIYFKTFFIVSLFFPFFITASIIMPANYIFPCILHSSLQAHHGFPALQVPHHQVQVYCLHAVLMMSFVIL